MAPDDIRCPLCGAAAFMVLNPTQAFCGDDECHVVMFNPSLPDGGMSDPQFIDLDGIGPA